MGAYLKCQLCVCPSPKASQTQGWGHAGVAGGTPSTDLQDQLHHLRVHQPMHRLPVDVRDEVPLTQPCLTALGLALGSPIFTSGCEGKLGVALESLQGRRDLT